MIKSNFFYNDKFYDSVEEFMIAQEIDEENIEEQPDFFKVEKAERQPVFKLTAEWILEHINEERLSEEGTELEKIKKLLEENINFDKINSEMPQLWYGIFQKFEITKADLYEALK